MFYKILQILPLLEPRDVNISGETYSGVPTKELRFGLGGEQPEKNIKGLELVSTTSTKVTYILNEFMRSSFLQNANQKL